MSGHDARMLTLERGNLTRVKGSRDAAELFGGLTAAGQPKLIADRVVIDCPSSGQVPGEYWEEMGSRRRKSGDSGMGHHMLLVGGIVLAAILLLRAQ
jgi:hypothetical protein